MDEKLQERIQAAENLHDWELVFWLLELVQLRAEKMYRDNTLKADV